MQIATIKQLKKKDLLVAIGIVKSDKWQNLYHSFESKFVSVLTILKNEVR